MSTTRAERRSKTYPPPLIVPSLSTKHASTMILLHGRGSNAANFAEPLLSTIISGSSLTFAQSLPDTRFIFLTASFRRATFANRTPITQWFDNYTLHDLDAKPEYQIQGLQESVCFLHSLINDAVQDVGAENVVVGGLSLGAATAMSALLLWEGAKLAGVFCMAGRLPMRSLLVDSMEDGSIAGQAGNDHDDLVVFEDEPKSDTKSEHTSPGFQALRALREELDLGSFLDNPAVFETPIFLGHGAEDLQVPIRYGRQAVECLSQMGCDVTWREYGGLGHWYSGTELSDILDFLRNKCNI